MTDLALLASSTQARYLGIIDLVPNVLGIDAGHNKGQSSSNTSEFVMFHSSSLSVRKDCRRSVRHRPLGAYRGVSAKLVALGPLFRSHGQSRCDPGDLPCDQSTSKAASQFSIIRMGHSFEWHCAHRPNSLPIAWNMLGSAPFA